MAAAGLVGYGDVLRIPAVLLNDGDNLSGKYIRSAAASVCVSAGAAVVSAGFAPPHPATAEHTMTAAVNAAIF